MAQFGRPSADTNNPGAYTDQAGGSANIYTTIDEVAASDADFVRSPQVPATSVYVSKLSNLTDPLQSTGHILRIRYAKDVAAGAQIDLTVELRQGYVSEASLGTLIKSRTFTNITETFTTDAYTLSGAEADAITDYTALYLRFISTQV
jgi:hypothetical protein